MKFYAVKVGNKPGIYNTWEECLKEVNGFKGAVYKSFSTYEEAYNFISENENLTSNELPTCYIDGSYDKKTGNYSFGGILLLNDKKISFKKAYKADDFSKYHNVAGEIKGAAYIINYCYKNNILEFKLGYDYLGIEKWYDGSWEAKSDIAILYVNFIKDLKNKIKIHFEKIKSHTGNYYNDLADKLAKEALGI